MIVSGARDTAEIVKAEILLSNGMQVTNAAREAYLAFKRVWSSPRPEEIIEVERWATRIRDATARPALIVVRTGVDSGLDVLDIDPRHDGYTWLKANHDKIPQTRIHGSRGGGMHVLFQHSLAICNSASRVAPGVDVRGEGGYIIWWPAHGLSVLNRSAPAAWPDWLLEQVLPPPAPVLSGPKY